MRFTDTHTHLYTAEFDADRAAAVARAVSAGAERLLLPCIDKASLPALLALCRDYPTLCRPMLGLHPTELPPTRCETEAVLNRFEAMLTDEAHPFVAIGEVGVDLYWDATRREEQVAALRRQVGWAVRYGLPLSIHARAAHREVGDTLLPYAEGLCGGVFHCFGGTADEARELLTAFPRFALGIGGVLTFKRSTLPAVLQGGVPLERLVLETDAPYLAPTPHRGQRNESAYLPLVIAQLSTLYHTTPDEVARITSEAARRIFPRAFA